MSAARLSGTSSPSSNLFCLPAPRPRCERYAHKEVSGYSVYMCVCVCVLPVTPLSPRLLCLAGVEDIYLSVQVYQSLLHPRKREGILTLMNLQ